MDKGFQGLEGQVVPDMPQEFVNTVSERYIELFEQITGDSFERADVSSVADRVEQNILNFLENQTVSQ